MVFLKEIGDLQHPVKAWTALTRVIAHLGEIPQEDYLRRNYPVLAEAVDYHGGLHSLVEANKQDLSILLQNASERHETSLLHWSRAMDGNEHAREKLVGLYKRQAERLASKLYSHKLRGTWKDWVRVDVEDLVQEGLVSLVQALPRYDPSKSKFPKFAHLVMEGAMKHYLRDKAQVIRKPAWVQELRSKMSKAFFDYQSRHGMKPTFEQLAKQANVPVEHVIEAFTHYQPVSLQAALDFEGTGKEGRFFQEPAARDELEPLALKMIFYKALRDHVKLSKMQAVALGMSADGHSLEEIATHLGVSPDSAGQLVYQAKKKIRENLLFKRELGIN
ncbi:MAG: sigma-70 family RNA polymerase sigma factor [Candidatus Norongarragalinales archaeon]